MIVLGKNYHVSNDHIVMKPIAKIEGNQIIVFDRDSKNELFPNSGKVYTPSYHQKITVGNFMVYELEPSHTYERNNEHSHYYMVKQAKVSTPLFEVYHVNASLEKDADKIIENIRYGFTSKVEMLKDIILQTSDHYLLGPFKTSYDAENRKVNITNNFEVEKYILPVYDNFSNQLHIATYHDKFDEIERNFTLTQPEKENIVEELDIATDDYIIREAIRFIKGSEEFSDITRRVSQGINEWLKDTTFSEEYNVKRLGKAVELLKFITPEDGVNNYQKYTVELLSLPSVKNIIEEQKEKKFESEYESFLKKNKDIINENKKMEAEHSELVSKITADQKQLKQLQKNIETYTQFMATKKENMEAEILEQYFQQLMINNLARDRSEQLPFLLNKDSSHLSENYENLDDVKEVFKFNLTQYGERDIQSVIFDYCLIALKFNQPLIIVGESSFKLAYLIQKTFAASKSQTIIPDTTHFSLNVLNDIKNDRRNPLNFTVIHNINVSPVSLNLAGFINVYESKETNNKIIFTFDSFDESKFVLEQLKSYSILNIHHRPFLSSPFERQEALKLGQLDYKMLSDSIQPILSFEDSIEELFNVIIENEHIEKEEKIEVQLKNTFRRLTYTNQFLGESKKSLKYFPFLEESLREV